MPDYNFRVRAGFFSGFGPVPTAVLECAAEHHGIGRIGVLDCRAPGYESVPLIIHDPVGTVFSTIGQISAVLHRFSEHLVCNFPDSAHLIFINFRHAAAPPGSQPKAVDWECGPQPHAEYQFFKLVRQITEAKRGEYPFEWVCLSEVPFDHDAAAVLRAQTQAECEAALALTV